MVDLMLLEQKSLELTKMKKKIFTLILCCSLTHLYPQSIGLRVGDIAPELAYDNPNGEELLLSELRGKIVLIDFWASWCGPCRKENPNIVSAYKEFKQSKFKDGAGFEIYSVSLDKKQSSWINAINKDSLNWKYHVSDLGGWASEGAQIYGVRSIPSNVLINNKGIIIARNLKGKNLHKFLSEIKQ